MLNVHVKDIFKRIWNTKFSKIESKSSSVVFKVQIEIKQEDFCTRGKEKKKYKQECHTVQAQYQQPHYIMYCCEHYCKMMSFVTKFFMHKICKSTWKGFYSPITKEIQKIVILHLQCCTFSIERAWKKNQLFNGATETGPVTLKCRFCKK